MLVPAHLMEIQKAADSLIETVTSMYAQRQYLEAYTVLQRAFEKAKPPPSTPWQLLHIGVKASNQLAISRSPQQAKEFLATAEQYLKSWRQNDAMEDTRKKEQKWTVVTLLNKGHWFQSQKKYHKALNALVKAKELARNGKVRILAEALLALSIFYTEIRSFKEAEVFARQTLQVLQLALRNSASQGKLKIHKLSELYVRAFAQIGTAEDKLGNKYGSLSAYRQGLAIAKKHLPAEDPLRSAIGSRVQRIRSSSNVRSSFRASVSTSMHTHRTASVGTPPRKSTVSRCSLKPADRYYSEEKLKNLHLRLAEGSTIPFLSTDQYFCKTISRKMNVSQDVQHLRPLSA